jgi:hypothetical protein
MPYMLLHCNNKKCRYNDNHALLCGATDIHYVDRLCLTFKRKPNEDSYRELMQVDNPNCHRSGGKWVNSRISKILK